MKKFAIILLLFFSLVLVSAYTFHNADNIFLKVNGEQKSLSFVLNNWVSLTGQVISSVENSELVFGHSTDEIIVDFNGKKETLTYVLQNLSNSCNSVPPVAASCNGRCNEEDICENDLCIASYSGFGCAACPDGYINEGFGGVCKIPYRCTLNSGSTVCNPGSKFVFATKWSFTCVY